LSNVILFPCSTPLLQAAQKKKDEASLVVNTKRAYSDMVGRMQREGQSSQPKVGSALVCYTLKVVLCIGWIGAHADKHTYDLGMAYFTRRWTQ
jgi:hypothetical protein